MTAVSLAKEASHASDPFLSVLRDRPDHLGCSPSCILAQRKSILSAKYIQLGIGEESGLWPRSSPSNESINGGLSLYERELLGVAKRIQATNLISKRKQKATSTRFGGSNYYTLATSRAVTTSKSDDARYSAPARSVASGGALMMSIQRSIKQGSEK